MIKWKLTQIGDMKIEPVEVVSETKGFIVLAPKSTNGRPSREAKDTNWKSYHDTFEKAAEHARILLAAEVGKLSGYLDGARRKAQDFEEYLKTFPKG